MDSMIYCYCNASSDFMWTCSSKDGQIKLWNINTYTEERTINPFNQKHLPTNLVYFSTECIPQVWCLSAISGKIEIYDCSTFNLLGKITDLELIGMSSITKLCKTVWIAVSGFIHLYSIENFSFGGSFQAHSHGKMHAKLLTVGTTVWSSSLSQLCIWTARAENEIQLFKEISIGESKIICLSYHPKLKRVYTGSFTGELLNWDSNACQPLQEIIPTTLPIYSVALDHLNDQLWCATSKNAIHVFSAKSFHEPLPESFLPIERKGSDAVRNVLLSHLKSAQSSNGIHEFVKRFSFPSLLLSSNSIVIFIRGLFDKECIGELIVPNDATVQTIYTRYFPDFLLNINSFKEGKYFELVSPDSENSAKTIHFSPADMSLPISNFLPSPPFLLYLHVLPSIGLFRIIQAQQIQVYACCDNNFSASIICC